jgi:peptide-methionine (R)-S-oxide reductase
MTDKIKKTDSEWREQLTEKQFNITRKAGTEPAFSGEYVNHNDSGTYLCICCQQPLFSSQSKFDSGCGWPSFDNLKEHGVASHHEDLSHGMDRTEVKCKQCDAHLGHVFDDGPTETGLRYCINSVAIDFTEEV